MKKASRVGLSDYGKRRLAKLPVGLPEDIKGTFIRKVTRDVYLIQFDGRDSSTNIPKKFIKPLTQK